MRLKRLNPSFFLTLFLISSLWCYSQNNESKIKLHSASIGFGGFYLKKTNSDGGGATFVINGTIKSNKNLVNLCYLTGAEIGVVGSSSYNFSEISIAYGRELKPVNWFSLEGFAGIGSYIQNSNSSSFKEGKAIAFPIKLNLKFFFTKKVGAGLNNSYSINQLNNNFSTNLIVHYNF